MAINNFEFQITKHFSKRLKRYKGISIEDIFYKTSKAINFFLLKKKSDLIHELKKPIAIPHLDDIFISLYSIKFDKNWRIICTLNYNDNCVTVTLFDICTHDDYEKSIDYVASIVTNEIYHGND